MVLIFSLLNIIGFILYIITILAVIHLLCVYNDRLGFNYYTLVIIIIFASPLAGYFLRDYAQEQKKLIHFKELVQKQMDNKDSKYFLEVSFANLDYKDKENLIQYIYSNLYEKDLKGKARFLVDYSKEDLAFINDMKKNVEEEISKKYDAMELTDKWSSFSKTIPFDLFEKVANRETLKKEFSKWSSDESAWARVVTLDSLYLSREYLRRYPNGSHIIDAKRIILDHEYEQRDNDKITKVTDYNGTSMFEIDNTSSYKITFSYQGAFAKDIVDIPANTTKSISVPNGYYLISICSEKLHTKSINEVVSCNSSYKSYNLELVRDY